jgi:chaperonin GroES
MTTIKPLGKRVLIEPLKPVEKTSSGLIIPDTAQTVPQEAMVISVGNEVTDVKIGDRVIYSHYAGTKLEYDGHSYIVVESMDLVCVVE